MAEQLQEVSSGIAQGPTHPALISPRYGTEKHLCFMHVPAQKHTQREKIPWVSQTEIPRKTLSSHRVPAVVAQINNQHALGQGHHRMSIACLHFHLKPSAGTCYLQTLARIKTIPSTRSTAPCEPAVSSPVATEMATKNKNLQGPLTHRHAPFSEQGLWRNSAN